MKLKEDIIKMIRRLYLGKCPECKKEMRASRIDGCGQAFMNDNKGNYYHWHCYWRKCDINKNVVKSF